MEKHSGIFALRLSTIGAAVKWWRGFWGGRERRECRDTEMHGFKQRECGGPGVNFVLDVLPCCGEIISPVGAWCPPSVARRERVAASLRTGLTSDSFEGGNSLSSWRVLPELMYWAKFWFLWCGFMCCCLCMFQQQRKWAGCQPAWRGLDLLSFWLDATMGKLNFNSNASRPNKHPHTHWSD